MIKNNTNTCKSRTKSKVKQRKKIVTTISFYFWSCKDSVCNDAQFILDSYVKGSNNKFVEGGLKG